MPLYLFGYEPERIVVDSIGSSGEFTHRFGGQPQPAPRFLNAPQPLHWIYRLDLRDQLIPIELPGSDSLPLLYPFRYDDYCCYQVVRQTQIKLLSRNKSTHFPPWNAPNVFPEQTTSFSRLRYDATSADDVMQWKGVFGWNSLSPPERERTLGLARERTGLTRDDAPDDDWTYEDVIRSMYDPPFAQSRPFFDCDNSRCGQDTLRVIALLHQPKPGTDLARPIRANDLADVPRLSQHPGFESMYLSNARSITVGRRPAFVPGE